MTNRLGSKPISSHLRLIALRQESTRNPALAAPCATFNRHSRLCQGKETWYPRPSPGGRGRSTGEGYSTVTDLARLRGWSISQPRSMAQ